MFFPFDLHRQQVQVLTGMMADKVVLFGHLPDLSMSVLLSLGLVKPGALADLLEPVKPNIIV